MKKKEIIFYKFFINFLILEVVLVNKLKI